MAEVFHDTNVLLYAVSTDPAEADKTQKARALLLAGDWAWSAQVAAEFMTAGTSPRKSHPLTREEARQWLETWMTFPMCPVDGAMVLNAVEVSVRYLISHYDAQIISAAKRMGCTTVYSEDLSHGQDDGGVQVVNPFLPAL